MAFSDKSKELRNEHNITQLALAQALKISRSCISMLEIGKNEPTASTLIAYSDYFQIPIDELLERDETTSEEIAAGVIDRKKISVSALEEDMLIVFRELGKKRGIEAQQAVINMVEKML